MATDPTQQIAPPTPDSIPITDPTASQSIPIDLNPEYDPAKDTRAPFLKVKPNEKGPTIQEVHKPLTQRIKEAATENIPQFSQRTVNDPNYGKESFLPDSDIMTQEERRAAPVAAGALDTASELGSPATIGVIGATAGLGEAPAIVSQVASALFAGQIAKSVYDQYPALQAAVDKAQHAKSQQEHDDAFADAQKILTHMGVDTAFGLLAAKHGAEGAKEILDSTTGSGVPDQASTFKAPGAAPKVPEPEETHPEMNRDTVKKLQTLGYSNQHITNFNISEIRDILKNSTPASEYKFATAAESPAGVAPTPEPDKFAEAGGKLVGPAPKAEASVDKPTEPVVNTTKNTSSVALRQPGAEPLEGDERIDQLKEQARSSNSLESRAAINILKNSYDVDYSPIEDLIMSDKIKGKKVKGATPAVDPTAIGQRSPEAPRGLVERTTGDDQVDAHIKAAGAIPAGNMAGLALFHDPTTGSTLALKSEDVTPALVQQHLAASRKSFGLAPEPDALAEAGGKFVGEHPNAVPTLGEPKPISDKLVAQYGTTVDPLKAGFILSDGRMVPLQGEHDSMLKAVHPEQMTDRGYTGPLRENFIRDENAVRTRFRTGKSGDELVFSVPKSGVNEDQISQIRQSIGKMGRNGNAVMEIAEPHGASVKKEFVTPADVEPMLQKIGAHPDQQDIVSKELQTPHKETYGMDVTDREGNTQTVQIDAHSAKQALATAVKKFPEAAEWRLSTMPEEKAPATEYSVPTDKNKTMPASMGRTVEHTLYHEHGHSMYGQSVGMQPKGIISTSHPSGSRDMRAAVLWDAKGLRDQSGKILSDKLPMVVASSMGGIAADEVFNGVHRAANHNFDIKSKGSDGNNAYRYLIAEGMSHDEAMEFMHQKIDEGVAYLKQEGVASVIHENVGVREKGLSRQFHASPERLKNMHAESQRGELPMQKTTEGNDDGAVDGHAAIKTAQQHSAGGEGGGAQGTMGKPEEGQVANAKKETNRANLRDRNAVEQAGGQGEGGSPQATEAEPAETEEGVAAEEKTALALREIKENSPEWIIPKGEISAQRIGDQDYRHYLLADGSWISANTAEHDNISHAVGGQNIDDAKGIRVVGTNMFDLCQDPTAAQMQEMARTVKESGSRIVEWELYGGNGGDLENGSGTIGDFQRAVNARFQTPEGEEGIVSEERRKKSQPNTQQKITKSGWLSSNGKFHPLGGDVGFDHGEAARVFRIIR